MKKVPLKKITILGAGSFGLTLAWLWQGFDEVMVWDRTPEKIEHLKQTQKISIPIETALPEKIMYTSSLQEACQASNLIVLSVTSKGTQSVCEKLSTIKLNPETIILNMSKGLVGNHLQRLSQIIQTQLPENPVAIFSGPSLAVEILQGKPTACSIASQNLELAQYLMQQLSVENKLRLYANTDVVGVELGGALKNIYAIGSGFLQHNNLGDNALAAYITRSLSEMTQFALAQGAQAETLFGLSGLGDLLATCNSPNSRNYQLGQLLAQGLNLEEASQKLNGIAEGATTTQALMDWLKATPNKFEMPIASVIFSLLHNQLPCSDVLKHLMLRQLKVEV